MKAKQSRIPLMVSLAAVLAFPGTVPAAEKPLGKTLVLEMKSGPTVQGELLAVKGDRLVLFDSNSLTGLDVGIEEVSKIRIVKPSMLLRGAAIGVLIGGAGGALVGLMSGSGPRGFSATPAGERALMGATGVGVLGLAVGGLAGVFAGIDESIDIDALPVTSQPDILEKLRGYARTAGEFSGTLAVRPSPVGGEETRPAKSGAPGKPSRFHLSVIPGYFRSYCTGQIGDLMREIGFNSPSTYWIVDGLGLVTTPYPMTMNDSTISIKDVRIEYSLSRAFALGVSYSSLGRQTVTGHRLIYGKDYRSSFPVGTYLRGSGAGNILFLTASFFPLPDAFLKKLTFKLTAGIGYAKAGIDYTGSMYSNFGGPEDVPVSRKNISRNGLGGLLAAEWSYFFNPHWSLGLNGDFKYVPLALGGFAIDCPYYYYENASVWRWETLRADVPGKTSNFGGWGIGLSFGYHF